MKCQVILMLAIAVSLTNHTNAFKIGKRSHKHGLNREPPPPPITQTRRQSPVKLEYVTQNVDNFNIQNNATFEMRYYRNDEFYREGGPILVDIGGEWTITPNWLEGGLMYDIAEELGGQMYYTEHRYYGESRPTKDLSLENLKYLSVDQSLADLAHFIEQIKTEPGKENAKVVVFGCSYAGTMATWFRQKYPHIVVGAKASSAPVIAKTNFYEYKEVVGRAIRRFGGEKCYERVANAFGEAEELAKKGKWRKLKKLFNVCDQFDGDNELDVWAFFAWLGYSFDRAVQQFDGSLKDDCDRLVAINAKTDLDAFVKYKIDSNYWCNDVDFQSLIDYYSTTGWHSDAAKYEDRQWTYQTCTEFGYFQTSASDKQPFGSKFPVNLDYAKCAAFYSADKFNPTTINEFINRTNAIYGGLDPAVKNVYFTHGEIDPWYQVGVKTDLNPASPVDVIPGVAHCADLYSISNRDSAEMIAVKERAIKLVKKWLE